MNNRINRIGLESAENWDKWVRDIPALEFKEGWKVKVIPPFAGAMARFFVALDDAHVSVYLDVTDSLGCVGQPYWEIYPYDNDVKRFYIHETDELIQGIDESLASQLTTNTN